MVHSYSCLRPTRRPLRFTAALFVLIGLLQHAAAQSREVMAKATAAPAKAKEVHKAPDQPRVKVVYRDRVAKPVEQSNRRDHPTPAPTGTEAGWNSAKTLATKADEAYKAQDYIEAQRYYARGAELGNTDTMVCLGALYEEGKGVA